MVNSHPPWPITAQWLVLKGTIPIHAATLLHSLDDFCKSAKNLAQISKLRFVFNIAWTKTADYIQAFRIGAILDFDS